MEADFQRHYGIDLGALCYGPAARGVRRIFVLLRGIPTEQSMTRLAVDGPAAAWTAELELAAQTVDFLKLNARLLFAIGGTKGPDELLEAVPRPVARQDEPELDEYGFEKSAPSMPTISIRDFAEFANDTTGRG